MCFADRIRSWRLGWTGQDLDAIGGEDRVKRRGEPGIAIPEQERQGGDTVVEVHSSGCEQLAWSMRNNIGTTATYVRADLPEIATALAALTGEPHPLAHNTYP